GRGGVRRRPSRVARGGRGHRGRSRLARPLLALDHARRGQDRFDTHFFLAPLPAGAEPAIDGEEIVDLGWFAPGAALAAYSKGELPLVFPTIKHLEQLVLFASADEVLTYARGREVRPVEPRVVMSG